MAAARSPDLDTLAELTATVAALLCSLEALGTFLSIKTKEGAILPFDRDIWHPEQVLYRVARTGFDLVLKARQVGFSTIALAEDLQYALTHTGATVLIVAHEKEQAEAIFGAIKVALESLQEWGIAPSTKYDNVREIYFAHTHSIVRVIESGATPKAADAKGRGSTVHRLHATEVAFWAQPDKTMGALLQCVPKTGEVLIESTPNGVGNVFHRYVTDAIAKRGRYRLHFFPWFVHPEYRLPVGRDFDATPRDKWERLLRREGCDDEQIAFWRSKVDDPGIGLEKTLAEYPCDAATCFRARGGQYIEPEVLDFLDTKIMKPVAELDLFGGILRVWARPGGRRNCVIGGDVSEGVGRDKSEAAVLDWITGRELASWRSDRCDPGDFGLLLAHLGRLFIGPDGPAVLAPERNNHGHATIRVITHEANYPRGRMYYAEDRKLGWLTSPATRPVLWSELRRAARAKEFWSPDYEFASECKTLVIDPKDGQPRALRKGEDDGCTDDAWTARAIAWQVRQRPHFRPQTVQIDGV